MSACWPVSQTTSHTLKGQKNYLYLRYSTWGLKKFLAICEPHSRNYSSENQWKNSANLIMVFHFIQSGHTAQSWTSSPRIPPKEHYKKCESQILTRSVLNYYGELWCIHAQLVKVNTEWRIIKQGPKQKRLAQPEYIQYKKCERIWTWNKRGGREFRQQKKNRFLSREN